ncbi:MAG: hypothetical protein P4L50_06840 [Anaerolineaceae bacterium]|nr:hypothetical protein [Anaerolineaceae bacterium]
MIRNARQGPRPGPRTPNGSIWTLAGPLSLTLRGFFLEAEVIADCMQGRYAYTNLSSRQRV